jgi:hypothetical protein
VDEYDNVISVIAGTFKTPAQTSDIDDTAIEAKTSKILRNGQLYILRGEKAYTITGQEIK